jgi:hypothetical protein
VFIVENVTMTGFEFFIGLGLLSFLVGLALLVVSLVRSRQPSLMGLTAARLRITAFASVQFGAGFLMLNLPFPWWVGAALAAVCFAAGFLILYVVTRLKKPGVEPKRMSSNQTT